MTLLSTNLGCSIFNEEMYRQFKNDITKGNYKGIISQIPEILKCEVSAAHQAQYIIVLFQAIFAMNAENAFDVSICKNICLRIKVIINEAKIETAIRTFIDFDYISPITKLAQAVDMKWLESIIGKILTMIKVWSKEKTRYNRFNLKKFFVVVLKMESLLEDKDSPLYPNAKAILEYFEKSLFTEEQIESGWPAILLKTLQACQINQEHANELLVQVRNVIAKKNEFGKDIAIMVSQIFAACSLRITSYASISYIKIAIKILAHCYNIIRVKESSSDPYWTSLNKAECCGKWDKHMAFTTLATIRKFVIGVMNRQIFDDALISLGVNFVISEVEGLTHLNCTTQSQLLRCAEYLVAILLKNIGEIILKYGKEWTLRIFSKLLQKNINVKYMIQELKKFYTSTNEITEVIKLQALNVVYVCPEHKGRAIYDFNLSQSQKEDSEFKTIVEILNNLKFYDYEINVKYDPLKLLFLQLKNQLKYPLLKPSCQIRLIEELHKILHSTNKSQTEINLIRANVYVLEYKAHIESHQTIRKDMKSKTMYSEPFKSDAKFLSFQHESMIVKCLLMSLQYFSKCLQNMDLLTVCDDENEKYSSNVMMMLHKIGCRLLLHQYKLPAIIAFKMLYKVAAIDLNATTQMIAAGFLVENYQLCDEEMKETIEKEIIPLLQTNMMQNLASFDKMKDEKKVEIMLVNLQMTKYMLHKGIVEHTKKYMQLIQKLLKKYDPEGKNFVTVRLKYSEIMFIMLVEDRNPSITPLIYIEDIFHVFNKIKKGPDDVYTLPTILCDVVTTLYTYVRARYEFSSINGILNQLWSISFQLGLTFLLSKVIIMMADIALQCGKDNWKVKLDQLDSIFLQHDDTKPNRKVQSVISSDDPMSPYFHSANCDCIHDSVHLALMEIACLKAQSLYRNKDYATSLKSFKFLHDRWTNNKNQLPYVKMLIEYSACLNFSSKVKEASGTLHKALEFCSKYTHSYGAVAQDIDCRMMCINSRLEFEIDETKPYENQEEEVLATPTNNQTCNRRHLATRSVENSLFSDIHNIPSSSYNATPITKPVKSATSASNKKTTRRRL